MPSAADEREILFLRRVRDLSHLLAREQDRGALLALILDAAIELTEAERGFLVLIQGRKPEGGYRFKVEIARGFDKASLRGSEAEVSRTVVKRVVDGAGDPEGEGLVTTDEAAQGVLEVSSVQARQVRSLICVPMRVCGQIQGVLYLDHRVREGAFSAADLPFLRTFADQAALAIQTTEDPVPEPPSRAGLGRLVGSSPLMSGLYDSIQRASRSWDPVLVVGEPGSGKDAVARELHEQGSFPEEPYQRLSCGQPRIQALLIGEAEQPGALFRVGRGTVVLDEVANLPPAVQEVLADALQERRLLLRGESRPRALHCRVLATTSQDLRAQVGAGRFLSALYYRLDVLRLEVPPLRARAEDIPALFDHLLRFTGRRLKLTPHAQRLLLSYSWPGNVRELDNEVRRLANLGVAQVSAQQLSDEIRSGRGVARARSDLGGQTLADVERHMVEAALADCKGNKSRAARQLGIPRTTLYHLLKRYGLS